MFVMVGRKHSRSAHLVPVDVTGCAGGQTPIMRLNQEEANKGRPKPSWLNCTEVKEIESSWNDDSCVEATEIRRALDFLQRRPHPFCFNFDSYLNRISRFGFDKGLTKVRGLCQCLLDKGENKTREKCMWPRQDGFSIRFSFFIILSKTYWNLVVSGNPFNHQGQSLGRDSKEELATPFEKPWLIANLYL